MLDALVDGQDREVPGAAEATVVEHLLQVAKDCHGPVALNEHSVDEVRAGEGELVPLDGLALVVEEGISLVPECLADIDAHDVEPPESAT